MQDRGLAAYITELVGTLFLVFTICTVVILYVSTDPFGAAGAATPPTQVQFGSDFAVIGLVHAFVLFALIAGLGAVSGGHFNPAVTFAAMALRRIDPIDGIVYILAQLAGAVGGAQLAKAFLEDEGRATNYGAVEISSLVGDKFDGMLLEAIGTFLLVLVIIAVAMNPRVRKDWAPLVIGATLGFAVMIIGPLTGGSFNPARWFGPALISEEWGSTWPYLVGPLLGCVLAAGFYRFVIASGEDTGGPGDAAGAAAELEKGSEAEAKTKAAETAISDKPGGKKK